MIQCKLLLQSVLAIVLLTAANCVTLAQAASDNELIRLKQIGDGLNKVAPYKVSVTEFYYQNGKFPGSISQLRMPAADKFRDDVIASLKIEGEGIIAVTFVKFPDVANAWIHLVPDVTPTHTLHWRCVSNIPDIDRTAPDCHYYRASSESETRILQQAQTQEVKKANVKVAASKSEAHSPAGLKESGKDLDCAVLKQFIENKLESKGVKYYQVNILGSVEQGKGRIVGQCNRGQNKVEYIKLPASQ